jgi:GNAT superfamily N-acetyltransferase
MAAYDSGRMDEVVTNLEMTSPTQLVPGRPPPAPIDVEEVGPDAAPVLRSTYVRIGMPLGWIGRIAWSDAQWQQELSRQDIRAWVARVDGNVAGFVELEAGPNGDVGIVVFGLVPEFVGRGFGGAFLTLATEMAWKVTSGGSPTRRVWVQTSSVDHPHALPNYQRRGFRPFCIERRCPDAPHDSE